MNKSNTNDNIEQLTYEARIWLKKTIIKEHPDWLDEQGNCPKCDQLYSSLSSLTSGINNN